MFSNIWDSMSVDRQRLLLRLSFFRGCLNWNSFPWFLKELKSQELLPDAIEADFEILRGDLVNAGLLTSVAESWSGASGELPLKLCQIYKVHPLLSGFLQGKLPNEEHSKVEAAFGAYYQRLSKSLLEEIYFEKEFDKRSVLRQLLQFEVENIRSVLHRLYKERANVRDVWGCVHLLLTEHRRYEEALAFIGEVISNLEENSYERTGMEYIQAKYAFATAHVWMHQYDVAMDLLNEVERLVAQTDEREKNPKTVADLQKAIAMVYLQTKAFERSLAALEKARELYEEQGSESDVLGVMMAIGDVLLGQRKFGDSQSQLKEACRLAEKLDDSRSQAAIFHSLGRLHEDMGDYARADEELNRALKLQAETNDHRDIGETLSNLGANANRWGKLDLARDYYNGAISRFIQLEDSERQGIAYSNFGALEMYAKKADDAIGYFGRAVSLFEKCTDLNGRRLLANALHNQSLAHFMLNAPTEGSRSLADAFQLYLELGDRDEIIQITSNIIYMVQQMLEANIFVTEGAEVEASLKAMDVGLSTRMRMARESGDSLGDAWTSYCLGFLRFHMARLGTLDYSQGEYRVSKELLTHAADAYRTIVDDIGIGLASVQLGKLAVTESDFGSVRDHFLAAATVYAKRRDEIRLIEIVQLINGLRQVSEFDNDQFQSQMGEVMDAYYSRQEIAALFDKGTDAGSRGAQPIQLNG